MANCSIAITTRPVLDDVKQMPGYPGWAHWAMRQPMEAVATVAIDPRDYVGGGWSVGWLQAMSFNNWAIYKGATPAGGSVWLQRASPTRDLVTILDSDATGLPFVFMADQPQMMLHGGMLPLAVSLQGTTPPSVRLLMVDWPNYSWRYQVTNGRTNAVNLLAEARIEMQFCAAVALRDPQGRFRILGGVFWTLIWANRLLADARLLTISPGSGSLAKVGRTFTGPPPSAEVMRVLTGPRLTNYNRVINANLEGDRQESDGWPAWPVRR